MTPKRVLVCGGRGYSDWGTLSRVLCDIRLAMPIEVVIHGGAKGADMLAAEWANEMNIATNHFPARWHLYGAYAGPERNQRMIDEGKPDLVVAFPGGRGTADMVRRARSAGIDVMEVKDENHSKDQARSIDTAI